MTQTLKGDPIELQMIAAASPAFDLCSASLDSFYDGSLTASPFLLMLYDQGRMPFSERVPRDSFVAFLSQALAYFPFTGTFESYLFILQAVFGDGSGVQFDVPGPGQISMLVNAASSLEFSFAATEFVDGAFVDSDLVSWDGEILIFTSVSGINSQYALSQLMAELIPAGIFPSLTLSFFTLSDFISSDGSSVVDVSGNQVVFIEK